MNKIRRSVMMSAGAVGLLAGGTGLAAAATALAAKPTHAVACVNSRGALVLAQNGACGAGLKKVSLPLSTATGPRGAAGAVGPQGPAGAQGTAGTNGTNGTNGAPGTARAWAFVQLSGTITSSLNVTSVTLVGTGSYCVHLAPAVLAGAGAATASPYWQDDDTTVGSPGSVTTAEIEGFGVSGCLDGVTVYTFETTPGTTTTNGSVAFANEPFYVLVG